MKVFRCYALCLFLLAWSAASGQTVRFAWLSDTHVGNSTGADDLRSSVRDINAIDSLDFVILSGDITEYGSNAQLHQAKSILDSLTIPYHIIPGNHDTKWSESGATEFSRIWGDDRFVFEAGGYRFIGMHEGPIMRMGDGQFSPEDIRWLEDVLSAMPERHQPIIFVTHYPLNESIANWYEVVDRLRQLNTQLVLVGHGHRNRSDTYDGIPGVMGRSNLRGRDSLGAYTIAVLESHSISFFERRPGGATSRAWHTLHLTGPAMDSPIRSRPDFSVNASYPGIQERWRRSTGSAITASPERWRDLLIIGNSSGAMYGLDMSDGSIRWEFDAGSPIRSSAAIGGDRAVFGSTDGSITCLKADDGSLQWRLRTGAAVVASPLIMNDVVYCGSSDGVFRAVALGTGRILWKYDGIEGFVEARPVIEDGTVIFGAWDGHLYGLDANTGALRWKWQGDHPGVLYSPAACWPVASSGRVFVAAPDRMVTCIDVHSGTQLWRTGMVQARETIGISEDRSLVFVRTMQDSIVAFQSASQVPDVAWISDIGFGYDINSSMIRARGDSLYYATKDGLVLALASTTGQLLWKYRSSAGMIQTPLPVEGGAVALAAYDGTVTMLTP
jgi:outer membrane protein assembly factor BamB/predicted phosphodiesterase